jgi:chromosome segregation ATPase
MGAKKKSETPVPKLEKTEKASKTPQPPKPVIKKEKEPSESFLLWMPEALENVEVQISNRKRLLETFDQKVQDIDEEVKNNLLIRDQQINSLNKTILALRAEIKSKEEQLKASDHSSKILTLQKEIKDLHRLRESFDESLRRARDEFEAASANWEDERDSLLLQQEAVVEEQQALTSRLAFKESEVKAVKDDIVQMGKIMNEMTRLNHELQAKIQMINENHQKKEEKYLKKKAKVKIVKELEEQLVEALKEKTVTHHQRVTLKEMVEGLVVKSVEDLMFVVKVVVNENNGSKGATEISLLKVFEKAHEISQNMKETLKFIEDNKGEDLCDCREVFRKIKEQEKKGLEEILNKKIKESAGNIERIKKDFSEQSGSLLKVIEKQKDALDETIEKSHSQLTEIEKKEADVQKLKKKITNQSARLEKSKQKIQEMLNKENEYKISIKNLQNKIDEMTEERKSTNNLLNVREKRVKGALSQIQVLREEIFNKDSEVLRKNKEILRLEKFLEELKGQVQQINSKMKLSDIETIKNVNKEIDDKDKQIAMLKEMLRSSKAEINAKSGVISHFKRKSENLNISKESN